MRAGHPPSATLELFARSELEPKLIQQVIAHLLTGCRRCRDQVARSAPGLLGRVSTPRGGAERYRQAFARASAMAVSRAADLERERAACRQVVPRLSGLPPARRLLLVRNSPRLSGWAFCEALWREGNRCVVEEPVRALELAELALAVACDLDEDRYGSGVAADLRARAAAELAGALERVGKGEAAREIMTAALATLDDGTGDPLLRARVYDRAAEVFPADPDAEGTVRMLMRAFHLYRRFGDTHSAGRMLIKQAMAHDGDGSPTGRLELLVRAAGLIEPLRDRRLAWLSVNSMLWGLVELGCFRAAAELLDESRHLYSELSDRLDLQHLARLEARIEAGLGDRVWAEKELTETYRQTRARGDLRDAMLVAFNLAALLLHGGRLAEAKILVDDLVRASERAGTLSEEAVRALGTLREALERPGAAALLVAAVTRLVLPATPRPRASRAGGSARTRSAPTGGRD